MRIAIVTDAWSPQINGVVRTLRATVEELERCGDTVLVIGPDGFRSVRCPSYPEIRLALARAGAVGQRLAGFRPDAIHLATEGPLCLAARRWCIARGLSFTTAYHTQFPEYVAARTGVDPAWVWRYISWFHARSNTVLASTASVERELRSHGIERVARWSRGIDPALFTPVGERHPLLAPLPRPIHLYVGRVAVEKNVTAFLTCDLPGSKVVVGVGPARAALERRFSDAHFLGDLHGIALAAAYRTADMFVFPSRTDTFGLVMIEALACGTPVAAFPVAGPCDVMVPGVGVLADDLANAAQRALACDRGVCARYGATFTWPAATAQFRRALVPIATDLPRAA